MSTSKDPSPLRTVQRNSPLQLVKTQGQLQIHTSTHRGSFSIVLSEALRSAGLGSKVLISQFLRGGVNQGPNGAINLCGRLEWIRPAIETCVLEHLLMRYTHKLMSIKISDCSSPAQFVQHHGLHVLGCLNTCQPAKGSIVLPVINRTMDAPGIVLVICNGMIVRSIPV